MKGVRIVDQNESLGTVRDVIEENSRAAIKDNLRLFAHGRDLVAEHRCTLRPTEDRHDWAAGVRFDVM